jgi:hypothetical protein
MTDGYPCPNPTCAHVFAADEIRGAAALVCPQCGGRFQLQAGADDPPPPDEEADPGVVVDWRNRHAPPPSSSRKLFGVLLIASGAVTLSLLGLWWFDLLPGVVTGRPFTFKDRKYNFHLVVPRGSWKEDEAVRKSLGARVALARTDPDVWLAVLVKDYKTTKPRDAELIHEGPARLRKHFKDNLELGDRVQTAVVAGRPALRLEFQGTRDGVVMRGDCYMLSHRGFAYWVFVWAPKVEDARAAWDELTGADHGLVLLDERPGWTEQPPKWQTYPATSRGSGFTVQAPPGVWEEKQPADEKELLHLVGRDPNARRGDNANNAYVVAYRLPKQPDLPAAVQVARDDLAAREKEKNEDFTVAPASTLDRDGAGSEVALGDRTGRTLELARLDGAEQKEFYLLVVVNEAEAVLVVQCRCGWEQRQMWRLHFLDLAGTLKVVQNP